MSQGRRRHRVALQVGGLGGEGGGLVQTGEHVARVQKHQLNVDVGRGRVHRVDVGRAGGAQVAADGAEGDGGELGGQLGVRVLEQGVVQGHQDD